MSSDPLDRLLSQTLRSGRTADVCPDAEQLAAFVERALGRDDRAAMEQHVSACARCAEIVSTLVASEPVAPTSTGPAWHGWHLWRWVAPTMAAAAIAGVWFASTREGGDNVEKPIVVASRDLGIESRESRPSDLQSRAPQEPDRQVQESRQAAASRLKIDGRDLAKERDAQAERPRSPSVPEETANRAKDTAPAAVRAQDSPLQQSAVPLRAESEAPQTQKSEAAAPPAAPSQPAAGSLDDLTAARRAETAVDEQARVDVGSARSSAAAPEAVVPAGAAAGGGRGGGRGGVGRGGAPAVTAGVGRGSGTGPAPPAAPAAERVIVDGIAVQAFAPVILRNRSGSTQWRVRGVSVERSNDGGATYAPAYSAARPLTAGAVAGDDTVWLVGEAGLVVHGTADGWAVAAAPVAADLIDISAVTARGATVRARDGREFTTEDGGASWRAR